VRWIDRWRARPRRARVADLSLAATIALLAIALVVNSAADIRQSRRMQLDQRVIHDYLVSFAGGAGPFGKQAYVRVQDGHDLVCAFLRHGDGGLCLHVLSRTTKSRKITHEYACINLPPAPHHMRHWRPPPPPKGQHWCPYHPRKVI
jgi:hypothetical protein